MSNAHFINLPSASIKTASLRYLDEFTKVNCAPDLMALHVFPNAKEITESFAAYHAVRRAIAPKFRDQDGACVVIGDGNTPRTGAVFAYRSHWKVYSVDPRLKRGDARPYTLNPAVKRLAQYTMKIEEAWPLLQPELSTAGFVVVVAVHSHAPLQLPTWLDPEVVVAIPCCVPQSLGRPTSYTYDDWGIHSPQRKVHVWRKNFGLDLTSDESSLKHALA